MFCNEVPPLPLSPSPMNVGMLKILGASCPQGVHDLRMDGGLPPGFQKGTLFQLQKLAVIPTFMMNFGGKPPIFAIFRQFLDNPPLFKENLLKKGPLSREFGAQTPNHMGGTYPYPQHVMYPPPPGELS